jgi:serine/threonine protein phosphatase PrpC
MFDEVESTVFGTPTTAGDVKLVLNYRLSDTQPGRPSLTHTVCLTVNPDPSSLWKNLPSDASGAFAKSDWDKASIVTPHLTAFAASLRGRSHAHEGKYRDDDFGMQLVEGTSWHIFIAADGAGSAKFSRRGSQIACKTALAELDRNLSSSNALDAALAKLGTDAGDGELEKLRRVSANLLMPAAYKAFSAIHQQAKESQATLRDFATTFIAVIGRQVSGCWFFAAFAIGDGGAGLLLSDGRVQLLTQPDSGDFAGQTVFLTMQQVFSDSEALLARTHAVFCEDFKFLAVMTDGITDPIFQSDTNFASAAAWELWRNELAKVVSLDAPVPGTEDSLLSYLKFPSPGNHDDRTLVIAVPKRTTA